MRVHSAFGVPRAASTHRPSLVQKSSTVTPSEGKICEDEGEQGARLRELLMLRREGSARVRMNEVRAAAPS